MDGNASFGYWVRRQRKALDLTQAELARRVGCAEGTIRMIEADARRPSRQVAARLADQLAIAPAERDAFISAARAKLSVDRLAPPVQHASHAPGSAAPDQPSGTVTFLFTDIEGSTTLWEQYPEAMPVALARHDTILRETIAADGGVIFRTVGDAVCAAFAAPPAALRAALAAQRALQAEPWGGTGPLRVRMALHTGSVGSHDGDYRGPPLNRVGHLLEAGYGGQILLSLATEELVREYLPPHVTVRSLGEHRLKDLSYPEQIYQLVAPDLLAEFPPLLTLDRHHTNLPTQPTPLIGRAREVEQVCRLLRTPGVRLLTLTGPGGVGKTRLALHAAVEVLDDFADGSALVQLAPVSDPDLVVSVIAQTLGVRETAGRPLVNQVTDYLGDKQLLLLLDNFEHIVGAATLVADLLGACPRLTVLVTSRAVLHLRGEKEFPVLPLALPDLQHLPPLTMLSQYEAVALFIARARDVQLDFVVTNENAPAVAEICCRLDGLPLVIELAAARVKLLAPQALLEQLAHRLTILTGGARDLPARQQTLRNTLDWSYHLLDRGEQALFRRLSVFVGGWAREAVEAICSTEDEPAPHVMDHLAALVDQSLVRQALGRDGVPRFVMLETTREYALEQLEASGEAEALRKRHACSFLALAQTAEPQLHGPEQQARLDRLEAEHDNIRAALAWSQRGAGNHTTDVAEAAEIGLRLASALGWFWFVRGYWSEGRAWLAGVLAHGTTAPALIRATALNWLAHLFFSPGDRAAARTHYEASLALGQAAGDKYTIATALRGLGMCTLWQSQPDFARVTTLLEESMAVFRELGDDWNLASGLRCLGVVAQQQRDNRRAGALYEASLALFRRLGDSWHITRLLLELGKLARYQGDHERAQPLYEECLALAQHLDAGATRADALGQLGNLMRYQGEYVRAAACYDESLALWHELGNHESMASVLQDQGYLARQQGDEARAVLLLRESLALCRELEYPGISTWCLAGLGRIALAQGHAERATQLLGAAAALLEVFDAVIDPTDRADYEQSISAARAQLDAVTFDRAWAAGRALTLEEAIDLGLDDRT